MTDDLVALYILTYLELKETVPGTPEYYGLVSDGTGLFRQMTNEQQSETIRRTLRYIEWNREWRRRNT